jgi:hypothetical protein
MLDVGGSDARETGFATAIPLFHKSFWPDLTHVNFLPPLLFMAPAFEHVAPALTAAVAGRANTEPSKAAAIKGVNIFFIVKSPFVTFIFSILYKFWMQLSPAPGMPHPN